MAKQRTQQNEKWQNDYVSRIAFLNEVYQERLAFLSTFIMPGFEKDEEKVSESKDGEMNINMDGVPLPSNEFLAKVLPGAIKGYAKYNILPSLTLAQAALESGWGKSGIGNNMFGIKAGSSWTGKTQLVWTTEEYNGVKQKVQAKFRDYDSIDDAVLDHAEVLSADRYAAVRTAKNYKEAAEAVKAGGYATDSEYVSKIVSTIESHNLDMWDDPKYKDLVDFKAVKVTAKGDAKKVLDLALGWTKKSNQYVFGGGRSTQDIAAGRFDCSSFVRYIFEQAGYNIGEVSGVTTNTLIKKGKKVTTSDLKPGDLVFFDTYKTYGHVTIYIGEGKCIGTQGDTGVAVIDMVNNSYWKSKVSNQHRRVL